MIAIIYKTTEKSGRVKFHLPPAALNWRRQVKSLNGTWYHPEQKKWSIVNTASHLNQLKSIFGENYETQDTEKSESVPYIDIGEEGRQALSLVEKELILRAYSPHTRRQYSALLTKFFGHYKGCDFKDLTKEAIEEYICLLIDKHAISKSYQNSLINAIKFYYENILKQDRTFYNLTRPKKSKELPNVLSEEEVIALINSPQNLKHQAILTTLYSAGLRLSELINLRIEDIHRQDGYLFIKGGKGKKDRHTVLSKNLILLLADYYRKYKPSYWLFEGLDGGRYSPSSVQKIFRKAVKDTGVNAWATPHTLRHSFATHLIERGVSYRHIQVLLGHRT